MRKETNNSSIRITCVPENFSCLCILVEIYYLQTQILSWDLIFTLIDTTTLLGWSGTWLQFIGNNLLSYILLELALVFNFEGARTFFFFFKILFKKFRTCHDILPLRLIVNHACTATHPNFVIFDAFQICHRHAPLVRMSLTRVQSFSIVLFDFYGDNF